MKISTLTLFALLWAAVAHAQTVSFCEPAPVGTVPLVFSPTRLHIALDDFTAMMPDTVTPLYDKVEMAFFLDGVDPTTGVPVAQIVAIDRTAFAQTSTTIAGLPCYSTPIPTGIPPTARRLAVRKVRTVMEPAFGPWRLSDDSFVALAALTLPGVVRVTK